MQINDGRNCVCPLLAVQTGRIIVCHGVMFGRAAVGITFDDNKLADIFARLYCRAYGGSGCPILSFSTPVKISMPADGARD